jgi:hypothetical protein
MSDIMQDGTIFAIPIKITNYIKDCILTIGSALLLTIFSTNKKKINNKLPRKRD